MKKKSLLGEIGLKFISQTENLATESLNFILKKSDLSKKGFVELLNLSDTEFKNSLNFSTQVYSNDDNSIPDLIGFDEMSKPRVIIEVKFWASLTKNQPVTYINRLPKDLKSCLYFLVPESRISNIYTEVLNKLNESGIEFKRGSRNKIILGENNFIDFISWKQTISYLKKGNLESSVLSDIDQLEGLCESINMTSFHPISESDIDYLFAKRNIDFCNLVDEVIDFGKSKGLFDTKGLNKGAKKFIYHRYFKLGDINCRLSFNNNYWFNYSSTPIWLEVFGLNNDWNDKNVYRKLKSQLNSLENQVPRKLYYDSSNPPRIPIFLKLNSSKELVLENMINQICYVNDILSG